MLCAVLLARNRDWRFASFSILTVRSAPLPDLLSLLLIACWLRVAGVLSVRCSLLPSAPLQLPRCSTAIFLLCRAHTMCACPGSVCASQLFLLIINITLRPFANPQETLIETLSLVRLRLPRCLVPV